MGLLEELDNFQLGLELRNKKFTQGEVIFEAFKRFLAGKMKGYEVLLIELRAKLYIDQQHINVFNFTLTHDTPKVREYLFSLVQQIAGKNTYFYNGTEFERCNDFMNIVRFSEHINDPNLEKRDFFQKGVINSLGKLLMHSKSNIFEMDPIYHLKDIACAFLNIPEKAQIEGKENSRVKEYKSIIDSILEESSTLYKSP